ncbi:hypothetical protein [Beduini massiliensis]|uniref:hypothetical protein n=1 Tax=Beduini massiliensis TaxID=1585974 RepID=UPI0012E02C83|nr:hypothetical protein [Beduini massiliensis]
MSAENEYEVCVVCHKELDIKKETPISEREFYIEGAGQVCIDCYIKLLSEKSSLNDY